MDPQRKETIIKEIKHWKASNLLPAHYCDFLLSLYSEGNETKEEPAQTQRSKWNIKVIYTFFLVNLSLALTVLVIYFTDFSFVMQMLLGTFFVVAIFFMGRKMFESHQMLAHLYYLVGALVLFILMVHGTDQLFPNNSLAMALTILLTCVTWLAIGVKFKLKYFTIAGSIGFVLLIFFLFAI
ncbi:hypothetical protein [Bacillus sp. FJAT-45350]|uniref:hypothetical protein n=1 Tax=Bacillus sp. FJAT-45350 TaxID=2011014 RepID=UPI000BB935FD|nr:hypothetical protein [Bacillus sp. FJAT-45350]